jgi:hypothetical protein
MNRIVLAFTIQWILFTGAKIALAQGGSRPPAGREPAPPAAAEKAPQRTPEAPPQHKPPQQQRKGEPPVEYKPVVFRLQNADCTEVGEVLDRIFFEGIVVPIPRTGSIIYAGPEDTLPQVMELLGKLDVPAGDAETSELTMIPVRHRRVEDIADQLMKVIGSRSGREVRMAADKGRSMLLIRGPKTVVQMAQAVVDELDKPAGSVSLEFAFFHADLNRKEPFSTIPADLAQVAEELQRFGTIELMGRLSAIAVENAKFRIGGSIAENMPQAQVEGELIGSSADGAVKLRLMAHMMLDRKDAPPPPPAEKGEDKDKSASRPGPRPSYELETSVQTKRGDYVVLGSAPTGWRPGESLILVMYVRP